MARAMMIDEYRPTSIESLISDKQSVLKYIIYYYYLLLISRTHQGYNADVQLHVYNFN